MFGPSPEETDTAYDITMSSNDRRKNGGLGCNLFICIELQELPFAYPGWRLKGTPPTTGSAANRHNSVGTQRTLSRKNGSLTDAIQHFNGGTPALLFVEEVVGPTSQDVGSLVADDPHPSPIAFVVLAVVHTIAMHGGGVLGEKHDHVAVAGQVVGVEPIKV